MFTSILNLEQGRVRFRSLPGSSKEILFIFFSMAIGLAIGMGYVSFAAFMTIVISMSAWLLFTLLQPNNLQLYKELKIVIPEDLDYTEVFDDICRNGNLNVIVAKRQAMQNEL